MAKLDRATPMSMVGGLETVSLSIEEIKATPVPI